MSQVIVKVLDLCKSALSKEVAKHSKVVADCQSKVKAENTRSHGELEALHRDYLIQCAAARRANETKVSGLFHTESVSRNKKEVAQQYLNKLS